MKIIAQRSTMVYDSPTEFKLFKDWNSAHTHAEKHNTISQHWQYFEVEKAPKNWPKKAGFYKSRYAGKVDGIPTMEYYR